MQWSSQTVSVPDLMTTNTGPGWLCQPGHFSSDDIDRFVGEHQNAADPALHALGQSAALHIGDDHTARRMIGVCDF
jgi:hypothetical protein